MSDVYDASCCWWLDWGLIIIFPVSVSHGNPVIQDSPSPMSLISIISKSGLISARIRLPLYLSLFGIHCLLIYVVLFLCYILLNIIWINKFINADLLSFLFILFLWIICIIAVLTFCLFVFACSILISLLIFACFVLYTFCLTRALLKISYFLKQFTWENKCKKRRKQSTMGMSVSQMI